MNNNNYNNDSSSGYTHTNKPSLYTRIRNSSTFHRVCRILQCLSAVISLGLFSARLARVLVYAKKASTAQGAVEGILAAAAVYTSILAIYKLIRKHVGPNWVRWLIIVLDLLFVGAFIATSYLTRPKGPAGPCPRSSTIYAPVVPKGQNCNLPYGTFALAIFSTILHFLTALFHQVKTHHEHVKHRHDSVETGDMQQDTGYRNGNNNRHELGNNRQL